MGNGWSPQLFTVLSYNFWHLFVPLIRVSLISAYESMSKRSVWRERLCGTQDMKSREGERCKWCIILVTITGSHEHPNFHCSYYQHRLKILLGPVWKTEYINYDSTHEVWGKGTTKTLPVRAVVINVLDKSSQNVCVLNPQDTALSS